MTQRTFLSLVNRLAPSVPGCPTPIVQQYIRDAAIEACERTLAWRYEQPAIRLTPGVYEYPYENPTGSEIHAFLTVSLNGETISPVTLEQLHTHYPDWPSSDTTKRSTPRFVCQIDVENFVVAPVPDSARTYDVRMIVALKPLRDADDMDKSAFDDLENVIMHGALQHLLVLPDRNWTDRELASYHAKQFAFKLSERRARANLGAARASMSVQMRPFA